MPFEAHVARSRSAHDAASTLGTNLAPVRKMQAVAILNIRTDSDNAANVFDGVAHHAGPEDQPHVFAIPHP